MHRLSPGEAGVVPRLFAEGQYTPILRAILLLLDGPSLHCAELVCRAWRSFIAAEVWPHGGRLAAGWRRGIPATRRLELGQPAAAMAVDEVSVAAGLEDGRVAVCSRAGLERTRTLAGPRERGRVSCLDMDTRLVIAGHSDGSLQLWCRGSGRHLATVCPHSAPVSGVVLDPPLDTRGGLVRQHVFSASRDCSVRRLALVAATDTAAGVSLVRAPRVDEWSVVAGGPVTALALDQARLVAGQLSGQLAVWSKLTRAALFSLARHRNSVRAVALQRGGSLAVSGSRDKTAIVWDLDTGTPVRELQHSADVKSVFLTKRLIVTADELKDIYIWDLEQEGGCLRSLTGHSGPVHSLHCERGGLVTCDTTGLVIEKDFWSCVVAGRGMRLLRCGDGVNCLVCDQRSLVAGLLNNTLEVYDRSSLARVCTLRGHVDHVWSVDMNSEYIVSGSWDSSVRIWDRADGRLAFLYTHPHGREISGVRVAGERILVTSLAGSLNVLKRLGPGSFMVEKFVPFSPALGEIYSVACDPRHVITGHTGASHSALKLWDAATLEEVRVIKEECSESIVWNLHLRHPLALVCRDSDCLDLYSLDTAARAKSLKHEAKVLCASLHGGKIVSGCQYGVLVIWDLDTLLATHRLHVATKFCGFCHIAMHCIILKVFIYHRSLVTTAHPACQLRVYEHSAAISSLHIDTQELITCDYDGVIILRNLRTYKRFSKVFKRPWS